MGFWTHNCTLCGTAHVDWICARCLGCEDCCSCGSEANSFISRQGKEGAAAIYRSAAEREQRRAGTGDGGEKGGGEKGSGGGGSGIREGHAAVARNLSWLVPDGMR